MIITVAMVRKSGLSDRRFIEAFSRVFPKGFEVTLSRCFKYADFIDFSIFADAVLPKKMEFGRKLNGLVSAYHLALRVIVRQYYKECDDGRCCDEIDKMIADDWRVLVLGRDLRLDKALLFYGLAADKVENDPSSN